MLTLAQITTFLWVARLGRINAAAKHLNLTQPAVSTRIANLEETLQVTLFHRDQTGLRLTQDGLKFREHAEQIEARIGQIEHDLIPRMGRPRTIRLGVIETIAQTWLADFIIEMGQAFPEVQIELSVETTNNLRNQLLERSVDLVLLMGPISHYEIQNVALKPLEVRWYRAKGWDDAAASEMPIITFNRDSKPFNEIRNRVLRGVETRKIISTASLSAGLEMVRRGVGVGALPRVFSDEQLALRGIEEFNGGPQPSAISFTASYHLEPIDDVLDSLAKMANEISQKFLPENDRIIQPPAE